MTQLQDHLPPPKSGLPLEVSFRRLLKKCEEIATGDNKGRGDLEDWPRSPVFHATLEALQEQIADLESFSGNRIEPGTLQNYRKRVDALAAKILPTEIPEYCKTHETATFNMPAQPAIKPIHGGGAATSGGTCLEQGALVSHRGAFNLLASHSEGQGREPSSLAAGGELRQRKGLAGPLDHMTQEKLERHKNLQDSLTDEMVALAAGLKRNAQAMQRAVNSRDGLLDATENAVEQSLANAQRSSKESKVLKVRGSITLCMILMAIFFVAAVFFGTYIFIKTTSFVGYKAHPR